jgi:hypothetical protein
MICHVMHLWKALIYIEIEYWHWCALYWKMQPHLIKRTKLELAICLIVCKHLNLSLKWCQCDSYVLQNSSYASCKYFDDGKLFQVSQSLKCTKCPIQVDFRFVDPHFGCCKIKQHLQSNIICWEITSSKMFFLEWPKNEEMDIKN